MQDLILTLHIIVCVLLVILILLQSGKEGMGVIFGGGNSSVFGSSGAGGILAKLTTLMAIIFVITSLSYTYVTSSRPTVESSILDVKIEDVPAQPAEPANNNAQAVPANEASSAVTPAEQPVTDQPKADQPTSGPADNPEKAAPPKPDKPADNQK